MLRSEDYMKAPTKSSDVAAILLVFVELQSNLISTFQQRFPQIIDSEYLLNSPRSGSILSQEEEWQFQRHGVGICFAGQKSSKVVDAHVGMLEYPQAFDAWRLFQYFESIGIEKIRYLSDVFDVSDEDSIENLLICLLQDGLIVIASKQGKLYTLK